jgi:hypothetical protein
MPLDRGTIDQQLQEIGEGTRWWDVRELRDLPAVLHADERILAISRGRIGRARWLRRTWLILVTDQRVLCVRSGRKSSWRQLEVPASHITRVTLRVGPLQGKVLVVAGGRKYRLLVPRSDANRLFSALSVVEAPANRAMGFAPTRAVRKVVDHLMALPAVALDTDPRGPLAIGADLSPLLGRLDSLEEQMHTLQQQVDFLEQLLDQRRAVLSTGSERSAGSGYGAGTDPVAREPGE